MNNVQKQPVDILREIAARYPGKFKDFKGLDPKKAVVVLCPAGIPLKWAMEWRTTYPKAVVTVPENILDVRYAMEALARETDPEVIHVLIITYEKAKQGEGWESAYNLALGKTNHGYEQKYEWLPEASKRREYWVKSEYVICPTTGRMLTELNRGNIVNVRKKQADNAASKIIYEGKIPDGFRTVLESIRVPRTQEYEEVETRVQSFVWAQNRRRQPDDNASHQHLYYPAWQESRIYKLPKNPDENNGRAIYKTTEKVIPEHTYKLPILHEKWDREQEKYVKYIDGWKDAVRREYTIKVREYVGPAVDETEPLDTWLAMKGVRCTEKLRNRIDRLMYEYDLKEYTFGTGNKLLDFELKERGISKYRVNRRMETVWRNPRYPLALYIRKRYADKVGLLIIDELHRAQSKSTDQSRAAISLIIAADKVLGMTGTLFNGLASGLYNIEFQFNEWVRKHFPWTSEAKPKSWIRKMGALENVYKTTPEYKGVNGRQSGTKRLHPVQDNELPAINPIAYSLLAPHTGFASLTDLGNEGGGLPNRTDKPIKVEMSAIQKAIFGQYKKILHEYLTECLISGDGSFTGEYFNVLWRLPDTMFREEVVDHKTCINRGYHPKRYTTKPVCTIPALSEDIIFPKEQVMGDMVREFLETGERVIVFCSQTDTRDIRKRLMDVMGVLAPNARCFTIPKSILAKNRMDYIDKMIADGYNVLVDNPKKLSEGVDLVFASRTIYFEIDPSLLVMSQSAARTRRINQLLDDVYNYYLYYEDDLFQMQMLLNVARKTAAADTIYGNEGGSLSAMSDTGQFAKAVSDMVAQEMHVTPEDIDEAFSSKQRNTHEEYLNSAWYGPSRKEHNAGRHADIFESNAMEEIDEDDIEEIAEAVE